MMNSKNYTVYSDKLRLSVLNLPQIHLATQTDRAYRLDYWAALFQSTTWEDIKMIASKNEAIQEAAETMYRLSQDEKIRLQCEALDRYYRNQRTHQAQLEKIKKMKEIEKRQKNTERKLETTKEKLEAEEGKHEATEGKLKTAEGKLEAAETELTKLRAELEALRAASVSQTP